MTFSKFARPSMAGSAG